MSCTAQPAGLVGGKSWIGCGSPASCCARVCDATNPSTHLVIIKGPDEGNVTVTVELEGEVRHEQGSRFHRQLGTTHTVCTLCMLRAHAACTECIPCACRYKTQVAALGVC